MKRLISILATCASLCTQGASHYITAGGGGSGTDGSDWSHAYNGLPVTLTRGDTYYIAGGTYSGYYDFTNSGSTYVFIKKANAVENSGVLGWSSAFESNQAVFTTSSITWDIDVPYISVDGVTGSGQSGYGIKVMTTEATAVASGWEHGAIRCMAGDASHLRLNHVEVAAHDPSPGSDLTGLWAFLENSENGNGIIASDIQIQNCYIHGGLNCVSFSGDGSTSQGDIVDHCTVGFFGGQEHCECFRLANVNNVTIRNNRIINAIYQTTTYFEPQQNGGAQFHHIFIYGNQIYATDSREGTDDPSLLSITGADVGHDVYIYNNTIYGLGANSTGLGHDSGVQSASGIGGQSPNIFVRNNLWQANVYAPGLNGCIADHNLLNTGGATFANTIAQDFHLSSQTPSLGANLGPPYNIDPDGNTRTTWSLGAYEFNGSSSPDTNPPAISQQPVGQTNSTLGGFTLSVSTSSGANIIYRWRLYGTNVPGATTSTYSSVPAATNQSGPYTVFLTNDFGSVTSAVAQVLITNLPPYNGPDFSRFYTNTFSNFTTGTVASVNISGANPLILAWVNTFDGVSGNKAAGVDWNGQVFSLMSRTQYFSANGSLDLWALHNPAITTAALHINGPGGIIVEGRAIIEIITNAAPSLAFEAPASSTSGASGLDTLSPLSTTAELSVDGFIASQSPFTMGANQTLANALQDGTGTFMSASYQHGQSPVTPMSWTGPSDSISHIAVSIKSPAGAGGPPPVKVFGTAHLGRSSF